MTGENKPRRLFYIKNVGLFVGICIAIYSSRESLVQIIDAAKGLAGLMTDARDAIRHTRQTAEKADSQRQQLAELTKLVKDLQRQLSRRSQNDCNVRTLPF